MSRVSVITNRGVGIVRSAANRHEKCEIVGAVSSTHFENTANELATKAGEWWDGATGTITMVRAGNGSLKVSVSFPATSYAQPLKSVGILVKAQGDERAHILYAVSDGNTAIALNRPYTCDYEIPINVSSDTIADVGDAPVPGLEDYYTKTETNTAIGNAITALNLGAASQKGVDTSIGDASSSNLPTSDAVKAYVDAHSGGGGGGDTSNLGASLFYDSEAKQIELKNTSKEVISSIDATAFIKDGMLDSVTVSGGNLNFVFNTDAGKETISIPLSEFFDASAYYTKTEVDADLENYYTKTEVDNKGYCTEAEVNTNLENYYTKDEINGGYYSRPEINENYYNKGEINENYYNKNEMSVGYYTKDEINVGYYRKDEINEDYYKKVDMDIKLEDYCTKSEVDANLGSFGSAIHYDSNTKKIELRNAGGETISEIDATDFVKDGMVDNVAIVGDYLVITFNTDAGKEAINIPMSSFFDASAYYTKTEINSGYYTKTEVDNKGYCTESEINANHYTKSEIDGGYIANASYNNATNTLTLSSKDGSKQIDLDLS